MNTTTALELAENMSIYARARKGQRNNPWKTKAVAKFVDEMDGAGYIFHEYEYAFDGYCIRTKWDQLYHWCESIAINERDTLAGR